MRKSISKLVIDIRGEKVRVRTYKRAVGGRHAWVGQVKGNLVDLPDLIGGAKGNSVLGIPPDEVRAV